MFLVGIFQWWYGDGLRDHVKRCFLGILRTADFFSVGLLTRTLFNPFRQISAASSHDLSLPAQLNAFFDRLFSRAVGTVVRTIMIIVGLLMLLLRSLWVGGLIIAWLVLPILPIVGLILWRSGVAP